LEEGGPGIGNVIGKKKKKKKVKSVPLLSFSEGEKKFNIETSPSELEKKESGCNFIIL